MARAEPSGYRWGIGAGIAALLALGAVFLVRVPHYEAARDNTSPTPAALPIGIAPLESKNGDATLREEAVLRDPAPLFLPSRWSASENTIPAEAWREPVTSFRGYEPKWSFAESRLSLEMPAVMQAPEKAAGVLAISRPERPFLGFGETGLTTTPLPSRAAFLEVSAAGSGVPVLTQALMDAQPPSGVAWQPLRFLVAVDVRGLIGPPVLIESSGAGAVDGYFQDYLAQTLRLGERLGPGYYRVGIGP